MSSFTHVTKPWRETGYEKLDTIGDGERALSSEDCASEDSTLPSNLLKCDRISFLVVWLCTISIALLSFDVYLRVSMKSNNEFHIKTPVPEIPLELVSFEATMEWLEEPSAESNARWMSEIGPSDGFIGMHNPREYSERPGIEGIGGENYGLSMFHGLHCLILIRQAWHEAKTEDLNLTEARAGLDSGYNLQAGHVAHCLDYLRLSIKCAGDMTLEWASAPGSRKLNAMGGELHVCRDFSASREFADQNLPFPRPSVT